MQTNISTERLSLRVVTTEDHEFICELVNTKGWLEFIGDRNVHSEDDAIKYIQKLNDNQNLTYWVVKIKETDKPIGIISFLKRDYLEHFDIGFAFLPEYNGYGYAYEAAKEVLSIVSKYPEYSTILATTIPSNEKSIRLLTKLGLRFEKELEVATEKLSCVFQCPMN